MAMNRIQFQQCLSLPVVLRRYGTESACTQAPQAARWPNGFVCPRCAGSRHAQFVHRGKPMWQCSACRHQCSLRAGTVFDNTKLPLTIWFLALHLLTQSKTNLSALELMRRLGVCYRTAWRLKHKLMQAMTEREADRRLGGWCRWTMRIWAGTQWWQGRPGVGEQAPACPPVTRAIRAMR